MRLHEISLTLDPAPPPRAVRALIEEAERRIDAFYEAGLGLRYRKYIPSDPSVVHGALACLQKEGHLEGNVFCEWGCGYAIASGIASLLGMTAYGIEIEEELAQRARELMRDLNLPVAILQTDYLPEGFDESEGIGGTDLIAGKMEVTRGGAVATPQYEGLDPAEVDLFFVYPWPGQETMMMDLFHRVSAYGSVLLIYLGDGEIAAYTHEEGDGDPDDPALDLW